jgi:serine/threonine protein phosphatase PrpC
MKIEFHGDTDIGQVRQINEDAFILLPSVHVMVVCDGMGGHAAGEVASREALQTFSLYFAADPERYAERLDFVTADQLPPGARHRVLRAGWCRSAMLETPGRTVFGTASSSG